jgi:hypothetical protein
MGNQIFISYSREDQTYARNLANDLHKRGFDVWIDDRIDYGDRWWQTIVQAILDSMALVVVMTPAAEKSEWVEREIMLSQREGKPIFPLLLHGNNFPLLITMQYVDVTDGQMPSQDFYDQLRKVMKRRAFVEAEQQKADSIKWDNSGNLFWVGHDLMLLIDRLLRGFPKDDIFLTLQQCLHHVRELGFGKDHPIESKLNELLARADRTPSEDWARELRDYYVTELDPLKGALGDLASANQERRYGVYNRGPKSSKLVIPLHE